MEVANMDSQSKQKWTIDKGLSNDCVCTAWVQSSFYSLRNIMIFYFPMGRALKFALQLLPKIGFPVYSKKEPPDGWQRIIQAFILVYLPVYDT